MCYQIQDRSQFCGKFRVLWNLGCEVQGDWFFFVDTFILDHLDSFELIGIEFLNFQFQAEEEVASLTKQLQQLEDDLDAAESKLADTQQQLIEAEKQADESER